MSKITISGTNGITGYEANNTTVSKTYSKSDLYNFKPSVFTSQTGMIIAQGANFDGTVAPPEIHFEQDDSTLPLLDVGLKYITSNFETATEGDQNHTMPSNIQAGDLLVMMQATVMSTPPGYGITRYYGTGFTGVNTNWYSVYGNWSGNYHIGNHIVSYKIATSSDAGATIGGFEVANNSYGNPYGNRWLAVFRPTGYSPSGTVTAQQVSAGYRVGTLTVASHQHALSLNPTGPYSCVVGFYVSNAGNKTATSNLAIDAQETTQNGTTAHASKHTYAIGQVNSTSAVTLTGPAAQTAIDGCTLVALTLS